MAAESILTYKRPGFPKITKGSKGVQTVIEYIGPTSTLAAAEPARNAAWGDYEGIVSRTHIEGIDNTDHSILIVNMESTFDASTAGGGDPEQAGDTQEITYEVEWTMFQRSIFEHPTFYAGGASELSVEDRINLAFWEACPKQELKLAYQFLPDDEDPTPQDLSANAQRAARLITLGIETFEDYAPVLRKTTKYSDGLPSETEAGQRTISGPIFAGKPQGYEWRKTADRSVRTSKDTQWSRVEEWTGAKQVLIDRDQVFVA